MLGKAGAAVPVWTQVLFPVFSFSFFWHGNSFFQVLIWILFLFGGSFGYFQLAVWGMAGTVAGTFVC